MPKLIRFCLVFFSAVALLGCSGEQAAKAPKQVDRAAMAAPDRHLLDQPDARMPHLDQVDFAVGRSFFRNPWVQAPASTDARDGLGPLFNAISCASCHIASARGAAPVHGKPLMNHVVRLSVPANEPNRQRFVPEPRYGDQFQNQGLPGVVPEGKAVMRFTEEVRTLKGGERVALRKPELAFMQLAYGRMHEDVRVSARMAPALTGLGLLQSVPAQQLMAWADPEDRDGDGISGRASSVWDQMLQRQVLGRFGWKAEQPTLKQQSAAAFHADMGISSSLFPGQNCMATQQDCLHMEDGGEPEISDKLLARVALYVGNLAVPEPRTDSTQNQAGRTLFAEAGCHKCHRPALRTGDSEHAWLSNRTIYPYTDLLLHDMGEPLADNRPVAAANGREWRTPPLWGIGLAKKVAPQTGFLHDGRARNVMEAILWHDGEAQQSRETVAQMTPEQRLALLQFIDSL